MIWSSPAEVARRARPFAGRGWQAKRDLEERKTTGKLLLLLSFSSIAKSVADVYEQPGRCRLPLMSGRIYMTPAKKSRSRKSSSSRKYGKAASKTVASAMRRKKRGALKSGKGGKGGQVKSRKQAIAIGLSEARKKGAKVPRKKAS
jgi:Family of unknown function (DUF6496)